MLFVAGATGDGGHFERVAEILSDEFTVVTYDRRGNSRSPRPDGWDSTPTEEHSEDAAELIESLRELPPLPSSEAARGPSSAWTSRSVTPSWCGTPSCTSRR